MLFKRKRKQTTLAKYKIDDYVNFRYKNELYFGFIYESFIDKQNNITYTIQIAGQCPALIYNYKEEDIIGLKKM